MSKASVYNLRNVVTNLLPIIPKHVFDEEGLLDTFSYQDIVGPKGKTDPRSRSSQNGSIITPRIERRWVLAIQIEKWDSGREIVLTRNENYWGRKPYLDKIVYRIINDYTAALTALKAGDIDLQPRLSPLQFKDQTGGQSFEEQFSKATYFIPNEYEIFWNNERPILQRQTRKAGDDDVGRSPENHRNDPHGPWPNRSNTVRYHKQETSIRTSNHCLTTRKRAAELLDEGRLEGPRWRRHSGQGRHEVQIRISG
jgi:hypothetical protein